MTYYVYILANRARGVLYVGSTGDLYRRIEQHKKRAVPSFTNTHGIMVLVYVEGYPLILEARTRERALKHWRRAWKFELIEKLNPTWADLSERLMF